MPSRPSPRSRSRSRIPVPLQVDNRTGSRVLNRRGSLITPYLKKLRIKHEFVRLPFADFALEGNGPKGKVRVGVERKTISELCSSDGRHRLSTHQLPGLAQSYDYRWIVLEGIWRVAPDGMIEVWKGRWRGGFSDISGSQLRRYLLSLQVMGMLWVWPTSAIAETVLVLDDLRRWWSKEWGEHRSHLGIEKGVDSRLLGRTVEDDLKAVKGEADWRRIRKKIVRRFAQVVPGIGYEKSKAVAKRFRTAEEMVLAREKDWMEVPGVGKVLSGRLPRLLRAG